MLFAAVFTSIGLFVLPFTLPLETASATKERVVSGPKYERDKPTASVHPASAPPAQTPVTSPVAPETALILPAETQITSPRTAKYTRCGPGDDGEFIAELQARLMELLYMDPDDPTTHYGPMTTNAVELFQNAHGLEVTGFADEETQKLLFDESAIPYRMKKGSEGKDVSSLQERLYDLGYFEGLRNGFYGTATERAVRAFQSANGLLPDGTANSETRELLYSPNAVSNLKPTPTPEPRRTPKATLKPSPSIKPSDTPKLTPKPTDTPEPTPEPTPGPTLEPTAEPTPDRTFEPTPEPSLTPSPTAPAAETGKEAMISVALAQLGKPYRWSEEGPDGFDCSGLVYYSLKCAGVSVSRYSASGFSQVESWAYVGSIDKLKRGDLMFFKSDTSSGISHTGIYLGDGTFVHASSSAGKVIISSVTSYYERNFVLGRRVF